MTWYLYIYFGIAFVELGFGFWLLDRLIGIVRQGHLVRAELAAARKLVHALEYPELSAEVMRELEARASVPMTDREQKIGRETADLLRQTLALPDLAIAGMLNALLCVAESVRTHTVPLGQDPFRVLTDMLAAAVVDLAALERELAQ
jgi:hypothetical protein